MILSTYFFFLFTLLAFLSQSTSSVPDCIFDKQTMWLQNCKDYCQITYNRGPQKAWYNQTSKMCQPLYRCSLYEEIQNLVVYNYTTNRCYYIQNGTQAPRQRPFTIINYLGLNGAAYIFHCIHGYPISIQGTFETSCKCNFLWTDSNKFDMNGVPFKCDIVVTDPIHYYVQLIKYDSQGNIIKIGNYTMQQVNRTLKNLQIIEREQTRQYILKHQSSIFIAIDKAYKDTQQDIFMSLQIFPLVIAFLLGYLIILISLIEEKTNTIYITKQELIKKIQRAIEEDQIPIKYLQEQ